MIGSIGPMKILKAKIIRCRPTSIGLVYVPKCGPRNYSVWIYCGDCRREFELHSSTHFGSPVVEMKQEEVVENMFTYTTSAELLVTFTLKNGEIFTVDEFIQPVIDGGKWHYEYGDR
jgi:hypothetical protein